MKKIISILLSIVSIFTLITGCNETNGELPETIPNNTIESTVASSEEINKNTEDSEPINVTPVSDFKYEPNENGGITITEYLGNDKNIVFPSEIDEKK